MRDAPLHNCCLYSVVACFQLAVSANLQLNVVYRMFTPTANMDPDQPNAETRAAKACLAVSEIMRVPESRLRLRQAQHARRKGFVPSENDAVMSVYPDIFWTPYDDKSPQDKATRE